MKQLFFIFLLLATVQISNVFAQDHTVSGVVTAKDDGLPIPGVTVTIKGTHNGTQTNANGQYTIKAPAGSALVFTFIGYVPQELPVTSNTTNINVLLVASSRELGTVVVAGYQTKTRSDLTSSISQVNGREVADRPIASVDELLQGKAAGVQVIGQNGRPGGNAFIRIRGTGSINGSQEPLLVVDGVQIPDNMAPQVYTTLNANDIENFSILKDAAAVSIYGARGSNGVVVITTKNGAGSPEPRITYSFQYGTDRKVRDNFQMMNAAQKLQYEYDLGYESGDVTSAIQNNGFTGALTDLSSAQRQTVWNSLIAQGHDWRNDIFRNGSIMSHQIAVTGQSGKTSYYASFQKYDENGITQGSDFHRYTGKINLNTEIKPWLSLSNNLTLGETSSDLLRDRFNSQNPFVAAYSYNPYEPVRLADGSYNYTSQGLNVLEAIQNNPETQQYITGYNSTTLDFHPIKGLNISSQLGMTFNDYARQYFIKPGSELDSYVGDPANPGSKTDNGSREFSTDWVNKAIYRWTVAQDHHFNALAVMEFEKDRLSSYSLSKKGFASGDLSTQDNGAANDGTNTTSKSAWTLFSLLGELDYNYKEKYFVTGSYRNDASSRFGANVRNGGFYSASVSWLLTKEDFLKDVEWLNVLKLRGSIGTSGNFAGIGNYQALGLYGYSNYGGALTSYPTQVANPNLTWEKKLKRDIGLDYEFWKSRVSGSIEYYNENTSALLLQVPLSQTVGFSSVYENSGAMNNKGIEFSFNVDVIRQKDLTWSVFGNINYNKNRVTQLYNGASQIVLTGYGVAQPGVAINTFKLVKYAGVNPQTGAPRYYDKGGNITETYSSGDAVVLTGKTPAPKEFGGFGTTVSYKGLSLTGQFSYSLGNYMFNAEKEVLVSWGDGVYQNQSTQALNYWKKPGDTNVLPKPSPNNTTYDTDYYLQNASFLRLRELTLRYTLPKSFTQKYKVQGLSFFATGQNLFVITKKGFFGDPEVGIGSSESGYTTPGQISLFSYPTTRQLTFGANLTF